MVQGPDERLRMVDVATGKVLREHHIPFLGWTVPSPSMRHVVSVGQGRLTVHDLLMNRLVWSDQVAAGDHHGVLFFADSHRFLHWSSEPGVTVRDLAGATVVGPLASDGGVVWSAAFSGDGRHMVLGSDGGAITVLDDAYRLERRIKTGEDIMYAVATNEDATQIVAGNTALELFHFAAPAWQPRRIGGRSGQVLAVAIGPRNAYLAAFSSALEVKLWDPDSLLELHSFGLLAGFEGGSRFSEQGALALSIEKEGRLRAVDLEGDPRFPVLQELTAALGDRDDPQAMALWGQWYALRGARPLASSLLKRAVEGGAPVEPLILARTLWLTGDLPGAEAAFKQAKTDGAAPPDYLDEILGAITREKQASRPPR